QTFGSCQGVRAVTQALDRRAHHRLAQPLPPSRQGLGKSQPQRPRVLETCLNPPHAPKALQSLIKFRNGLLRGDSLQLRAGGEHVPTGDRLVVSCRIHRFLFGAGVDTLGVEKSAFGFPEGFTGPGGPCSAVSMDLAGQARGPRVSFETTRTWT